MTRTGEPLDIVAQLPSLRRYAHALTRDAGEAEDLVHDALVRAYARRQTFRLGGNLRLWLLSIVHNTFIGNLRARQAERSRIREAAAQAPTHAPSNQDQALRLAQIGQAFLRLPEDQRAALHLIVAEGLSYQEAAASLGIPVGTLMSRLGRARAALRDFETGTAGGARQRPAPRLRLVAGDTKGGGDDPAA